VNRLLIPNMVEACNMVERGELNIISGSTGTSTRSMLSTANAWI